MKNIWLDVVCLVFIFSIVSCIHTNNIPKDISNYVENNNLSNLPPKALKVKIYVESYVSYIESPTNIKIVTFSARAQDRIKEDFEICQKIFEDINLSFEIQDINFVVPLTEPIATTEDLCYYDKNLTPSSDEICIYYIFSHNAAVSFSGYSVFPWHEGNTIFIVGAIADKYTLAHEIGHYLGLYHTFEEDFVDDTPGYGKTLSSEEIDFYHIIGNPDLDPNYNNLMNYTLAQDRILTDGQLKRARYFLIYARNNAIKNPSKQYSLDDILNKSLMSYIQLLIDAGNKQSQKTNFPL